MVPFAAAAAAAAAVVEEEEVEVVGDGSQSTERAPSVAAMHRSMLTDGAMKWMTMD